MSFSSVEGTKRKKETYSPERDERRNPCMENDKETTHIWILSIFNNMCDEGGEIYILIEQINKRHNEWERKRCIRKGTSNQ